METVIIIKMCETALSQSMSPLTKNSKLIQLVMTAQPDQILA